MHPILVVTAPPVASVVMPMRNAAPFVEAALRSVLAEDELVLEVVVVNDGSTDESAAIVRSLGDRRIKLIDGPQAGIAACLNRGFAASGADVVMRCDADDLYPPGRIARQTRWLLANPDHGAVCGGYAMMSPTGRPVARFGSGEEHVEMNIEDELQRGILRTHLCTFAWRKSLFADGILFRDYFETAEDLDLQLRLGERCQVRFQPGVAYFYRLHDTSITHRQGSSRRVFYEQTARSFQRERLATGADALQRGNPPVPPSDALDAPMTTGEQVQGMLIGRSWFELSKGRRWAAVRASIGAVCASPLRPVAWMSLAKLLLKSFGAPRLGAGK